jgi:hypothetical protein
LLVGALGNLLVYFFCAAGVPIANTRRVAVLTLLCAAFSIPQLLAVWALPNTAADLFFFCIFGAGLAFGAAVAWLTGEISARVRAYSHGGEWR